MRTIYICCSTVNQIVNLHPLLQIDRDSLSCVIMLVGAARTPTPIDRNSAIIPAERFDWVITDITRRRGRDFISQQWDLSLDSDSRRRALTRLTNPHLLSFVTGQWEPDAARDWADIVTDIVAVLGEARYILNLTGGKAAMQFGALAGLQDAVPRARSSADATAVIYLAHPPRTIEVHPTVDDATWTTFSADEIRLEHILKLGGYAEIDVEARCKRELCAIGRGPFTCMLFDLLKDDPVTFMGELHRMAFNILKVRRAEPDETPILLASTPLLNRIVDLAETTNTRFMGRVGSEVKADLGAVRYLDGSWFEEYVFLECRLRFDKDVALGVRLKDDDKPTSDADEDGQLDVVVLLGEQLHFIECKTKTFSGRGEGGMNRKDVDKAGKYKRQLIGPYGTAALLSFQPPLPDREDYAASLAEDARKQGVEFWRNPESGVRTLRDWLGRLRAGMAAR